MTSTSRLTTVHSPSLPYSDYSRLSFVISAPRGGALTFCNRIGQLGGIGLPHTHLPIRHHTHTLDRIRSPLDLFGLDDGLVRSLSYIIYGGFQAYQLEAAFHDLSTMYSRSTFSLAYSRLLSNTSSHVYDPSFSMSLFPSVIPELWDLFPGSSFIFVFRDPLFFVNSILTSIHGLDSLLLWWILARDNDETVPLDPLFMWCSINEALLDCKAMIPSSVGTRVIRFPESVGRFSISRVYQLLKCPYATELTRLPKHSLPSRLAGFLQSRLLMTTSLRQLSSSQSVRNSPILGTTSWWLDVTQGGDPSAEIPHHSDPLHSAESYWRHAITFPSLIQRCDQICGALSFPLLSRRLRDFMST